MDAIAALQTLLFLGGLVAFDLAALRWGADSRRKTAIDRDW